MVELSSNAPSRASSPISPAVRRALHEGSLRRAAPPVLAAALAGIGAIAMTATPSFAQHTALEAGPGDGSEGFILHGIAAGHESGTSVSAAGDVNGDGFNDLIIGSPYVSYGSREEVGESYVVFGRATGFPPTFELRGLRSDGGGDGSEGFVLRGIDAGDVSGLAVSDAGDLNDDGIDDLVIGPRRATPRGQRHAGECYVVFGRTSGFPPLFELASLYPAQGGDGSEGFMLIGMDAYDGACHAVDAAGDVNGDGVDDLVIGASGANPNGKRDAGETYVVFGRATGFPPVLELRSLTPGAGGDGSAGFILKGIDEYDSSGGSVSGAGDVNGDGVDDLIIGARGASPAARSYAGESYLVFGRAGGFPAAIELASLLPGAGGDGSAGVVLRGIGQSDQSGASVDGAGDVNDDGIDDVIIGALAANTNEPSAGQSYVVFGRESGFPAVLELKNLQPGSSGGASGDGFVLYGIGDQDHSGRSVGAAGDVNGDGIEDLIIGAFNAGDLPGTYNGESYVVFGRTSGFPAAFNLRMLFPDKGGDGSEGFVLNGIDRFDASGVSVSRLGDVNGDGIDDLIIGAPYASPNGRLSGESYVVFGRTSSFPAVFELSALLPP